MDPIRNSVIFGGATKRKISNGMNRRNFLKTSGSTIATLAISNSSLFAKEGVTIAKDRILDEADKRIEKFRKGDIVLRILSPHGKPVEDTITLEIKQTNHKFLFGCNIFRLNRCRTPEDNIDYERHFAELLNFATLPFYWWNYERQRGQPDDARTDEIVRWCKAHNVTTKGHPLAWNRNQPPWLSDDPEAAMQAQLNRVRRCVQRFKNDIDIWDVVNEATHYDRPQCKEQAPKLTEAISRMGVGEYVRQAFKTAREANPKARLIINDYRTDPSYAEKIISQLVDENGQPLYDCLGIQSHMHRNYWGAQQAWDICERFAKFVKPLHFTETTVVSGPRTKQGWHTTPEGEKRQAEQVSEFYRVLFSHPAVEAITWWDFTDQGAWQGAPAGLVRADMTPKPAYQQLMHLIKGKWWTKTEAKVEADSKARFRGFFGQYKVTVHSDGRKLTGSFWFDKNTKDIIYVRVA